MAAVVLASNVLVQYPFTPLGLQDVLTWGAFTYPWAFFVTDLTNRRFGPIMARRVVYVGFALAVALSVMLAAPRIALASGCAFLLAQLLDVVVFDRLRHQAWWRPPLVSSVLGSLLDTAVFFSLAFAGAGLGTAVYNIGSHTIEMPVWIGWAFGDLVVKLLVALVMLLPFRALRRIIPPLETAHARRDLAGSR
ncbi:queuosine precursor transporter [Rhodoligotrophos defluvii]|uniref:queuosine precursor transporter n=1 Tax=Rhodoligotrophos defluvii TaxID=2561934 RepID=UPI0010C9D83C|nr:queuosine precursor transporter [Rhodoligotrophos defluvii]